MSTLAVDPPAATYSHPKLKNVEYVANVCRELKTLVQESCASRKLALTIGGDHSLAMGTVSGSAAVYGKSLGVIWVDAHAVKELRQVRGGDGGRH